MTSFLRQFTDIARDARGRLSGVYGTPLAVWQLNDAAGSACSLPKQRFRAAG